MAIYPIWPNYGHDFHCCGVEDDDYIGFEEYPAVPGMPPLTVSDNVMTEVARRLKGGAGLGGVNSYLFKDMLLRYGRKSTLAREEMGAWGDWITNDPPRSRHSGPFQGAESVRITAGRFSTNFWPRLS